MTLIQCWKECKIQNDALSLKKYGGFLAFKKNKFSIHLPYDLSFPHPIYLSRKNKLMSTKKKICVRIFKASLFTNVQNCTIQMTSTGDQINKL